MSSSRSAVSNRLVVSTQEVVVENQVEASLVMVDQLVVSILGALEALFLI